MYFRYFASISFFEQKHAFRVNENETPLPKDAFLCLVEISQRVL